MSRTLLLLPVLLATGLALAAGPPEPDRPAPAAEAKPPAEGGTAIEPADDAPAAEPAATAGEAPPQTGADAKALDGMSVLGNQEAPKSLVIVPWKSSEIGGALGISTMLDDSRQPVDKEVFLRALSYYEIRSK